MQGPREWAAPAGYVVSTDPARLDVDRIYRFLSTAYWSAGIPRELVQRSIANSLPFGLYAPSGQQVGFARVVTDRATYAYLGDVYVEAAHRGRGLGKLLVSCVVAHPELQDSAAGHLRPPMRTTCMPGTASSRGPTRTSICSSSGLRPISGASRASVRRSAASAVQPISRASLRQALDPVRP
jgi:Acetyltransferase (GNAT) family